MDSRKAIDWVKSALFMICLSLPLLAVNAQTIVAGFSSQEGAPLYEGMNQYLTELSEITGLEFELIGMPLHRLRASLLDGTIDLDLGRSSFTYSMDEPVIFIHPPMVVEPIFMISDNNTINPLEQDTWIDLTFVTPRWNAFNQDWIKRIDFPIDQVEYVPSNRAAGMMIANDRADFTIAAYGILQDMQAGLGEENKTFYIIPPAIDIAEYFFVLSERLSDLAPLLSEGIQRMNDKKRAKAIFGLDDYIRE